MNSSSAEFSDKPEIYEHLGFLNIECRDRFDPKVLVRCRVRLCNDHQSPPARNKTQLVLFKYVICVVMTRAYELVKAFARIHTFSFLKSQQAGQSNWGMPSVYRVRALSLASR